MDSDLAIGIRSRYIIYRIVDNMRSRDTIFIESRIPNPESRIPNPESRIPNPESRLEFIRRKQLCCGAENLLE